MPNHEPTPNELRCVRRVKAVWEEAIATYQLPDIDFTLLFRSNRKLYMMQKQGQRKKRLGLAQYNPQEYKAVVSLNRDAVAQDVEDMLNDVIPHEIAHIVCMAMPQYGHGHNQGWQAVCKRLGGTGNHMNDSGDYDMRLRKLTRYVYNIPGLGIKHLSHIRHNELRKGRIRYRDTKTGIAIEAEHFTGETVKD